MLKKRNILKLILSSVVVVCLAILMIISREKLALKFENKNKQLVQETPLYLPKLEAVKSVTLGYEHFVSSLFWFSTLNYFGEKFIAKESMPWFNHRCDLVTDLDPKARHVFEFCGTLLSWIAKEPLNARKILDKGIRSDPKYWRYYYLRGFNNWYFLENFSDAKTDFEFAATLSDSPTFLVSLASRLMVKEGNEETAIAFLKATYVRTSDINAKNAIGEKIALAEVARDLKIYREAISKFKTKNNRLPASLEELVKENYLKKLLIDPYKKNYLYEKSTGSVRSEQGGEGLQFKGKTASSKAEELLIKKNF